jgi:hypothetical protein
MSDPALGSNIVIWGFTPGIPAEQADWKCFIDEIQITPGTPMTVPANNWYLCGDNGLLNYGMGLHTLTINVTSNSPNASLWFDWIQYIPQPGYVFDAPDSRNGVSMLVENSDSMVHFDDGWMPWATGSNITWQISSSATIDFIGERSDLNNL